jgi:hypothetical protein
MIDLLAYKFKFLIHFEVLGLVDLLIYFVHLFLQHFLHGPQLLGAGLIEELLLLHLVEVGLALQVGVGIGVSRMVFFGIGPQ